jgi:hypothetical protein
MIHGRYVMASLRGLTIDAVDATLAEYDAIGREAFLTKYEFGDARGLYLVRDGKRYESKAVVGAAIGRLPGRTALRSGDFSGGIASVVRALDRLGYTVIDERAPRNPKWATEEIILALDLYLTHGQLDDTDPEVEELSVALNALNIHPSRPDAGRWRNPNGVALKLANFAHFDPGYPGRGMSGGSKLDEELFEKLQPYPDLVSRLAADIRSGARVDPANLPIAAPPLVDRAASGPAPSTAVTATPVPVEQYLTLGKYEVSEPAEPVLAERVEQPMVLRFCDFLSAGGYPAERVRYSLDGVEYVTDIVVRTAGLLLEAKYHTGRGSIRMAVGQIKDYDFMESEANESGFGSLALLLGGRPTESALRYLAREGIDAAWPVSDGWAATDRLKNQLDRCAWC